MTGPADDVSTWTSAMAYPVSAVIVNASESPKFTSDLPGGLIVPCAPAEAAMLNLLIANVAEIVWFACTASNVYCDTAPTEAVSTCTSAIEYPASGVMVNMSESPKFTTDLPAGAMDP